MYLIFLLYVFIICTVPQISSAWLGLTELTEYNEVVTTKDAKTIDAFSSQTIHARMKTACIVTRLNVMTQALCAEEGSLPQGLTIQNAYTNMHKGSKNITIIMRNSTVYPQTLKKMISVAREVVANQVPGLQI